MTARKKSQTRAPARSTEPLYREVRAVLESARAGAYLAVSAAMVEAYWHVGRLIVEHEQGGRRRAAYGEAVLEELSGRLTADYGRGFDARNLSYMRQFYLTFAARTLRGAPPAGAENRNAPRSVSLAPRKRNALRSDSAAALPEAGGGLSPAREARPLLRCFVLIDLKVGKLTHQDIGQMDSYVRVFDAHARPEGDNPTIGLILCSKKNEAIARYSVLSEGRRIFAARYVKVLPTEEQLEREITRERRALEGPGGRGGGA